MENSDLHSHSYYSDGFLSPAEVVQRAKKKGVKILALTDHNSVAGVKEAFEESAKQGISLIPAVELKFSGGEMLGYFVDINNKQFQSSLEKVAAGYTERTKNICEDLKENGIDISLEKLQKEFPEAKNNLTWTHLLYYLYKRNFRPTLGEISRHVFQKIIWRKTREINVKEAIKIICDAGGVPVLAHPWITSKSRSFLEPPFIEELIKAGLKGLEIDQGDRNERRDKKFVEKIKNTAKKYNLILTSGSDFHGDFLLDPSEDKGHHDLGLHNCDESVTEGLHREKGKVQKKLF